MSDCSYLSNSLVFLSDGQELYCENYPEDIKRELAKGAERITLIISTQNGMELSVHRQHIVAYHSTD